MTPQSERGLVVRKSQQELEAVSASKIIENAGITPLMMQQLGRLNELLVDKIAPPLYAVDLELVPGKIPLINTNFEYHSAPRVRIRAQIGGNIEVTLDNNNIWSDLRTTFGDIKQFLKTAYPERKITLIGIPHEQQDNYQLVESPEPLQLPLNEVTEEMFEEMSSMQPMEVIVNGRKNIQPTKKYPRFEIILEGKAEPVFSFGTARRYNNEGTLACTIHEISIKGEPKEIDKVLPLLVDLFDTPYAYPFNLEDDEWERKHPIT